MAAHLDATARAEKAEAVAERLAAALRAIMPPREVYAAALEAATLCSLSDRQIRLANAHATLADYDAMRSERAGASA